MRKREGVVPHFLWCRNCRCRLRSGQHRIHIGSSSCSDKGHCSWRREEQGNGGQGCRKRHGYGRHEGGCARRQREIRNVIMKVANWQCTS